MSVRKMMLRAGLAAMAVGWATSASAAKYLFEFGGVVDFSTVTGGTMFGTTGFGLVGKRFSATITYDDATPGLMTLYPGSTTRTGTLGFDPPPTTGSLTINGITPVFPSVTFGDGEYQLWNNSPTFPPFPSRDLISVSTGSRFQTGTFATDLFYRSVSFNGMLIDNDSLSLTNSLNLADLSGFVYTGTGARFHTGNFRVEETAFHNRQLTSSIVADGSYQIDRFTITRLGGSPGGVPEPASWALMIAGFGLIGGAMRRRTVTSVTYA